MAYHCATSGLGHLGIPNGDARLICDGCGLVRGVQKPSGMPYAWLLNRKAAPGWAAEFTEDNRMDWCPRCREKTGR